MQFFVGQDDILRRAGSPPVAPVDGVPSGSRLRSRGRATAEVDAYLKDQERIFEEIKARHPMPPEMIGGGEPN
jgi:predicted methyltransferase MtxX (methanogen marker protein 4)